jgi:NAD(P)-dependent dehydrogenase (short-subunit alcohol dehydrogenase family)
MVNPMDLSGRLILVTGASSGIGRDTAVLLSDLGARVVLTARHPERLICAVSDLAVGGHHIEPFDLSAVEQIPEWTKAIATKLGPLDGLVHCAGVHSQRPLRVLDAQSLKRSRESTSQLQ